MPSRQCSFNVLKASLISRKQEVSRKSHNAHETDFMSSPLSGAISPLQSPPTRRFLKMLNVLFLPPPLAAPRPTKRRRHRSLPHGRRVPRPCPDALPAPPHRARPQGPGARPGAGVGTVPGRRSRERAPAQGLGSVRRERERAAGELSPGARPRNASGERVWGARRGPALGSAPWGARRGPALGRAHCPLTAAADPSPRARALPVP